MTDRTPEEGAGGRVVALCTDVHRWAGGRDLAALAAMAGAGNPDTAPLLRCCPSPLVWTEALGWVHLATGLPLGHHLGDPTPPTAGPAHAAIAVALHAAAEGTDLRVTEHPELPGARLTGPRGEAYLLPKPHGITVELWRPGGDDAYRVERLATLDAAVNLAVEEVADVAARRAWRTRYASPGCSARMTGRTGPAVDTADTSHPAVATTGTTQPFASRSPPRLVYPS